MVEKTNPESRPNRRIPARVPALVDGLASLRRVAGLMMESGLGAVLVDSPAGLAGLITAKDVIEAIAAGADPDICWAGEIMRPVPRVVSCDQHPTEVGEEMLAYELDVVTVVTDNAPLGVASALDILGAVIRTMRESRPS